MDKMIDTSMVLNRLKRAEGQLRGIQKMIEDNKECEAIVTQLAAVRSSIDRVTGLIVAENLRYSINNPENDEAAQQEKIAKAVKLIVRK